VSTKRAEWDRRYAASELVWSAGPNRFVAEEIAGMAPGRALDLAAGEGRNAIWLAGLGWRVTAVDFSAVAIGKARRLAQARGVDVGWVTADLLGYRPDEAAHELVLIAYLHLPPKEFADVLSRAVAALAPDGTLLIVGHDASNLTEGVGGPQDAEVLYRAEAISALLDGLDVRRAERVRRPVETDGGPHEAIDTLVRAVRI
jgi:SAM-dependent methyltransferase